MIATPSIAEAAQRDPKSAARRFLQLFGWGMCGLAGLFGIGVLVLLISGMGGGDPNVYLGALACAGMAAIFAVVGVLEINIAASFAANISSGDAIS